MSIFRTNKKMKQLGGFLTRTPKESDFTEYVYCFDDIQIVISRSEISPEVDEIMYTELKKETNNNEVQIEKHRGYSKNQEKHDALLNMQPSEVDLEELVIQQIKKDELRKAVKTLKPKDQELIYKKYFRDMTNTQIAKEEGVTEGAIRDRLKRMHKQLEKKLLKKL